ncbi:MAG: potassium transporter TrkA [Anaerolineae bacterium UTCFX2]|jgi:trk system potassium uptake protein TrkA|nr:NAD-binding protein [Anaerolineae bacterium]MCZ7554379.1 NAD-binding protein [Anaerolineales bacterium]OQY90523.1 MAG: potassium transporter TrkA [Anaerolineae bacterium UTCFX2]
MFVVIAGGGRTGTQLAQLLLEENHEVRVIEQRKDILARLHRELPTEVIFEGNASELEVLGNAGASEAEVVVACTASDEDNLVICYSARKQYNVRRTIARINDPRNAWLFDEKFCVDVALNASAVIASLIVEEMSLGDMMTLLKLRRGDYSLVEEKIPAGANAVGIALKDLGLREECVIAAIIRDGKVILPSGMTSFEVGDEVLAVTNRAGADHLRKLFSPVEKIAE